MNDADEQIQFVSLALQPVEEMASVKQTAYKGSATWSKVGMGVLTEHSGMRPACDEAVRPSIRRMLLNPFIMAAQNEWYEW